MFYLLLTELELGIYYIFKVRVGQIDSYFKDIGNT